MTAVNLPPALPRDLISIYDLMYMFEMKSYVTVWKWRTKRKLPYHAIPGSAKSPAIRYSLKAVVAWADRTELKIKNMPYYVLGEICWVVSKKFQKFKASVKL